MDASIYIISCLFTIHNGIHIFNAVCMIYAMFLLCNIICRKKQCSFLQCPALLVKRMFGGRFAYFNINVFVRRGVKGQSCVSNVLHSLA